MIDHINDLIERFGEPPKTVLEQKSLALATSLEKDCYHLPSAIKSLIYESFLNVLGMSITFKKIKNDSLFTAANLVLALNNIKQGIDQHTYVIIPTKEELDDISLAASKLWDLDINRAKPDVDYVLDLQEGKSTWDNIDNPSPLFSFVDEKLFEKPTYNSFRSLLDNYHSRTGQSESFNDDQKKEMTTFLNHCGNTAVFQYLHQYLLLNNKTKCKTMQDFLKEMHSLWFDLYSRHSRNDSSGFEHVFVGEIKDNEVTGLHNWVQILSQEKLGRFNYKGFIKPKRKATKSSVVPTTHSHLITMGFEWDGFPKPMSSTLFGVSPEFEIALYTLCYKLSGDKQTETDLKLASYVVRITCFNWKQGNNNYIATSFPSTPPLSWKLLPKYKHVFEETNLDTSCSIRGSITITMTCYPFLLLHYYYYYHYYC